MIDISNSVIIINKPCGQICHEITTEVKKIVGAKRSGHAGTLDPDVSGVLPVALGRATKLLRYIAGKDKTYVALMKTKRKLERTEIDALFREFRGEITQTPPKISAVRKVARKRTIHELTILEANGNLILFRAKVDAGTYIRTLCEDMGKKIGGARMIELRRIAVGKIKESEAYTMHDLIDAVWLLKNRNDDSELKKMLRKPDELIDFPKVVAKDSAVAELKNGAQLAVPGVLKFDSSTRKDGHVSVYSESGKFVGVGVFLLSYEEFIKMNKGIAVRMERVQM